MQVRIELIDPRVRQKPIILSLDSGAEFSLEHWLNVRRLVEEAAPAPPRRPAAETAGKASAKRP